MGEFYQLLCCAKVNHFSPNTEHVQTQMLHGDIDQFTLTLQS